MEQRKLIQFGKSAFCITMPHTWLKKNRLKKGDSLSVQETLRNSLEIMPVDMKLRETQDLTIEIAGKSAGEIVQLLFSAYLNGYTTIILLGPNAGKVAIVRRHVHEIIAAEIMEVTSNKIVINIFWDITTINLRSIISRIGHITKSILTETIDLLDKETDISDIVEKGYEVQRQVLLARRAIKCAMNSSMTAHKFNLSPLELLYVSYLIYFLGTVGDYILKVTRIIDRAKITKFKNILKDQSTKKDLKQLLQRTSDYYSKVMNTFHKHDNKIVKFLYAEYAAFESDIDNFQKNNLRLFTPILTEYIKVIVYKIRETEFMMISMDNMPK